MPTEMTIVDYVIVVLYLIATVYIGAFSSRRVKDFIEYAVAGRSYPAWIVFATLSASFIGGGFTMGNSEKVYSWGIVYIVALWGFSFKEILVATFIAPRIHQFPNAISAGDVMERDYGKLGKFVTGVFSVILCAGILGAQVGGMGAIFKVFLGLPVVYGIIIGIGIVILYDTMGGMRAVVSTDILQFIILAIGIPLVLFFGVRKVGGVQALLDGVPEGHLQLFSNVTPIAFLSLFLTFFLGEALVPPYIVRLFIGGSAKIVSQGTLWSGLFSIPFFAIAGCLGLVAYVLNPHLENSTLALPETIRQVLPIGIRGFVVAGMIAVVMSSADSFLNSASIAFVNDVVAPLRRKPLSVRGGLMLARASTLITGTLAIIFAIRIPSLLDILIYAYNFWSPVILVPLVSTLLGYRASKAAFAAGAASGAVGVLLWKYVWHEPAGFEGLVIGVFCNLAAFVLVNACTVGVGVKKTE